MRKTILILPLLLFASLHAFAAHIIGGEMRYTYVGPGTLPNTKVYRLTLILFRGDDPSGAALAASYPIAIYNNDNNSKVPGPLVNSTWQINRNDLAAVPIVFPTCISGAPTLDYTYGVYTMDIQLADNLSGYTATYQTCCRINGLANVGNSVGSTYTCRIPGSNELGASGTDSSPAFGLPVNVICRRSPFTLNFSATDPNPGDSLVYYFCDAFNGGAAVNAGFDNPAPPPYGFVPYNAGFSAINPFGTNAVLDSHTGIISGMAPDFGKYVVCVCIDVYRNGVKIASHKKDLIVQVSNCEIPQATLTPKPTTCNGFDVSFQNETPNALITTTFWDFGVASLTNDTTLENSPTFHYPAAGDYTVTLITNKGLACSDTATVIVKVYPGFRPGFDHAGGCYLNPYRFTDTTQTDFGVVNSWSWNFGDATTLADTSHLQNPQWTYATPGIKTVTLTVTNDKGCSDTRTTQIEVFDKPVITLDFKDTLICLNDAVTLGASGTGTFSWSPTTNMTNANSATPTVQPTTTTWYYVNLTDNGCANKDSVRVRVVSQVSLAAMPDTTICRGDAVTLKALTDGLTYLWSPAATIDDPTKLNPVATPVDEFTTYTIKSTIGSCSSTDAVTVRTVPYPVANAGNPQTICYNASTQLNGSHDGSSFSWSPTSYLNNPNILNPIASPPRTTSYVLTVFDTKGCPKPGRDTVVITILPKVRAFAGRDTIVTVNQPLQFNGSGGVTYQWSPGTGLSSTTIPNPVGIYNSSIDTVRYKLIVADAAGCVDSAFMRVVVFKTRPSIFVASAFTPNNDGKNDVIYPVSVGMHHINYFSIYNRWGQLVFTTTRDRHGWDGRINGRLQDTNVYVWMVSAVDYEGKTYFLKGTVTLIR